MGRRQNAGAPEFFALAEKHKGTGNSKHTVVPSREGVQGLLSAQKAGSACAY